MQFCKLCESKLEPDGTCSNRRCTRRNLALLSWIIDGKLQRFKRPVTLAEAREAVRDKADIVYKPKMPPNKFCKVPTW
jgi:hypothetical protein